LSSILKALKKLENQATDQNHVRFWRPQNHTQNDDHEQLNGHLRLKKRYVIIFAGLVLAVGAGLILNQKFYEKKPVVITKKEDILEKPVRLPEKKAAIPDKKDMLEKSVRLPENKAALPDKKDILEKSVRLPENKAAIPDSNQKELSFRKDEKPFEPIAKPTPTPAHKSRENTAVIFNQKTSPLEQTRKETVTGQNSEEPEQNTKTDRFASIPVKRSNQTNIDLQAIAWSKYPENRLAVINGLILRERESIDNVIVIHIGKDAVVFKKGVEEWKQMFGF
jgi:hypothetical protein